MSRALFIAAQAGYWELMASPERYRVYAMINYVGTPLTKLLGYAPGRPGLGEDLPKDVFLQWAGWVMKERYLFQDPNLPGAFELREVQGPAARDLFTDDPWATRTAVELLCSGLTGTKPEIISVRPVDAGAKKIGHFGFFRPEYRDTLWRGAAEWMQAE